MSPDVQPMKQPWEPPRMAVLDPTAATEGGSCPGHTESVPFTTMYNANTYNFSGAS